MDVFIALPVENLARDSVMTVSEDVRFDDYFLPHNTLDGEPPAVNLRRNPFNYDPASPVRRLSRHLAYPPYFPVGLVILRFAVFDATPEPK